MPPRTTRTSTRSSNNICDYEGSTYRTDFWEGQGREYEDKVERIALRRLLPPGGGVRMLELGAGFGRLTDEYHQYKQVVLLDYSFTHLLEAQELLGKSDRFIYVAADAYRLPFRPGVFDGTSMIRALHHMSDVPAVLNQVRRVMTTGGVFILEHANKQNLKAMMRYALKRQSWSPYDQTPVEFVELNFDFHPEYVVSELEKAKFKVDTRMPVSFFRVGILKNTIPVNLLAGLDGMLQHSGMLVTPSIFTRSVAQGDAPDNTRLTDIDSLFVCPESGTPLKREGDTLFSRQSGLRYAIRDGIYDFKAPLD